MGRDMRAMLAKVKAEDKAKVEAEVESGEVRVMDFRPDNISQEVWDLIQENGELATMRLNEILSSPRFHRIRASDQAKLIALAQNRAYGMPQMAAKDASKRQAGSSDVTQAELNNLVYKATLPEYKRVNRIDDAEIVNERADDDDKS